jgi:uncharacterized protein (DUF2141 family)
MRIILAFFLLFVPAAAASLSVRVANIGAQGGDLHVALYNEALWPDNDAKPLADIIVPAIAPETTVIFKDVTPGVYGVKTYQDANRNDKFDQNFLGLPLERYGFSRDARPRLAEPSFSRAKFAVSAGANAIVIHLQ